MQKRNLQRTRIVAIAFGIAAVISILFFVFGWIKKVDADKQKEIAENNRVEAEKNAEIAEITTTLDAVQKQVLIINHRRFWKLLKARFTLSER